MKLQLQLHLIQPAMKEACLVLDRLLQAGFSAFFVGGAVRDTVLERPLHDIDIATNARPEQVMELFPNSIPTGLQHGTVTVRVDGVSYEVTTFRKESGYTDYRRPMDIAFVDDLHEDLMRRDFTMNAMAIDRTWQLHDPYGGLEHMKEGILKTVGSSEQRFQEDALRMLRAIRFATTYKLSIDQECWDAMLQAAGLMKHIAMERVAYELERLLQADDPIYGIVLLSESSLLQHTKDRLHIAAGTLKDELKLPNHRDTSMNWAVLFHSLAVSSEQAREDMRALRTSKQLQAACYHILQLHEWLQQVLQPMQGMNSGNQLELGIAEADQLQLSVAKGELLAWKEQWLDKLLHYPVHHLELFLHMYMNEYDAVGQVAKFHEELPIQHVKQLAVRGNDLVTWCSQPSGPWINECLKHIFIEVASGRLVNSKEAIRTYVLNQFEGGRYNE